MFPSKHTLGFTYLGVLFAVAFISISLALVGSAWKTSQQRENEMELLFIGDQFRKAIGLYYERTPGPVKKYPKSFDELITDNRSLVSQHYLRKIYRDPMTNELVWGLILAPDGGVMGVHSLSEKPPRKQSKFKDIYKDFESKPHYSDWRFIYYPYTSMVVTKPEK